MEDIDRRRFTSGHRMVGGEVEERNNYGRIFDVWECCIEPNS
jgi:hypothetical protein